MRSTDELDPTPFTTFSCALSPPPCGGAPIDLWGAEAPKTSRHRGPPRARCAETEAVCADQGPRARLLVEVSRDEEYVRLQLSAGGRTIDLGQRTHNYMVLILARHRLSDTIGGMPDPAGGWLYVSDYDHDPSLAPPRVNLAVHRLRRRLSTLGLGWVPLFERRPGGQIRLGLSDIRIVRV